MNLKEKITQDLKDALKSGDSFKRDTLRLLDSAIKNAEIEKKKREEGLSDEEILEVVSRAVKQRNDSIEQFEKGGRPELAEKEKAELEILKAYLPEQLSEEEIRSIVKEIIAGTDEVKPQDMGRIMGQAMGKMKGRADGNLVRKVVNEEIAK
ncbi:MAG TPA: GatB/YqeY domain-containing protein [Candidatus Moranbacteria bacterium]|jgi:hypothetical protein|nr:GatB/YqeY domain-containing protein [Candidatus Moranbacteria bacterium]HOF42253.1 GatB/YqeY domain-containing protein [Candidatus Moranbacteria bacterium]HPX94347.1 GatB/YqeY domain-containing protein [Candidatus Moranbacteria bacterium]HQB59476.1 GatB/YqeY domain-containing protein [Candidatus Moranbacteria bacterium]